MVTDCWDFISRSSDLLLQAAGDWIDNVHKIKIKLSVSLKTRKTIHNVCKIFTDRTDQ